MKRVLAAVALACFAAACATPRAPAPATPPQQLIDPARLHEHIRVLSSDAFQGRAPATPGEEMTVDYIARQFEAVGLQPGGENGGWFQSVPLLMSDITGTPRAQFAVGGQAIPLQQGPQIAIRANMSGQSRVNIQNAPVVFAGYGVVAPECQWNDYAGMDVRGKVVIVLVNDPDFDEPRTTQCFGGEAMTYYGRWTYKYEEAARQGAAGLIIVHETEPASYGWATVQNSNTNTMFDIVRPNPAEAHPALEGWIQRDIAMDLFRRAGLDFTQLRAAAHRNDFRAVTLPNTTFSADYQNAQRQIISRNVAGRLPGTTRPNETVIYSGHHDHLGVGAPDARGDRIFNGAIDNATGIAALIELGRAFAQAPRTERSVVFLAVGAEEKGLLGSAYYAANPLYPLETTVGVLNMDAFQPYGPTRDMTSSGNVRLSLQDDFAALLRAEGRSYTPDPRSGAGSFYRSDHFPFARVGVPAISVNRGSDLIDGGVEASRAVREAYTRDRYHQPSDEYDPTWDLSGMAQDFALIYRLGRNLATSRTWPTWGEGAEFRAIREQSAAARR